MKRRSGGFSLTELCCVLAIAAIALSIGLPDLRSLIRRHQLDVALTDLLGAIALARSEAIGRGQSVLIVPLDAGGSDWSRGWTIFADRDGDLRPGEADDIIMLHGPLPEGVKVSTVFTSKRQPDYLAFNSAGRSCAAASSATARWGTLSLFQQEHVRRIKINMLGRARGCDPAREAGCGGAEEGG